MKEKVNAIIEKKIWLDCDGTWIDLYGVNGWLDYILNEDPFPYAVAKPLVNLSVLADALNKLQANGYEIGIISWTAKNGSASYNSAVKEAKLEWLKVNIPSVHWDNIFIVPYGTPKSAFGGGYLWDDELKNRKEWHGIAYDEKNLINDLMSLL